METTVKVSRVSFLAKDKAGNPLNLFVLALANGQESILRTSKEFLTDLRESGLIGFNVNNINHPEVRDAVADLKQRPFTVTGNIKYAKEGELWTVTKDSSVITDKTNPQYGKVSIGDKLPYKRDMTLVEEGFLAVRLGGEMLLLRKQATANAMLSVASAFEDDFYSSSPSVDGSTAEPSATGQANTEPADSNDIPDDVMDAVTGKKATTKS